MLGGDTEEAAIEISRMFDDPRVKQYWDPKRLTGTSYSAEVFPTYLADLEKGMKAGLPDDHWWHQEERNWKDKKPEQAPLWDVAFTYGKDEHWREAPPPPRGMVKQVLYSGGGGDGPTELFFTDFKKPVRDGDWIEDMSLAMTSLMGREPKTPAKTKQTALSNVEPSCQGTRIQALPIALKFDGLKDADIDRVQAAVGAMKGVMRASFDSEKETMTVLADANGSATAEKIVEFVRLAGYNAREANEEELEQALDSMRAGGAIVIRREAEPEAKGNVTWPDTPASRTARAFVAACNSGDSNKMREYSEVHRSKSALESRSVDERLEQYRELLGDWGQLDVRAVESHDKRHVTVTVKPERGFSGLAMTFQCEDDPPHKLDGIRITPTILDDGDDKSTEEEGDEGKMGDITVLAESLKPLQDHFNANKDKHRFIAILSPT